MAGVAGSHFIFSDKRNDQILIQNYKDTFFWLNYYKKYVIVDVI